jgi:predicted MFS family arabinose efflux permease
MRPPDEESDPRYGWAIVGALSVTVTVSYGVLTYAFGVLLPSMQRDLGWSKTEITGAFSLALLISALAGLAIGQLLDRRSPRLLMSAGSIAGTIGVLAWSQVDSIATLYAVFALLGLAMAAVLYEPVFTVVTKWFAEGRRAALTTVTLVGATASLIFSPLTQRLDAAMGWRDALVVLALVFGLVTLPLHLFVLRPVPRRTSPPGSARRDHTVPEALRTSPLWLFSAAVTLGSFAWSAIAVHLVSLLLRSGADAAFAALALGLLGIAQLPGRVVFGLIGRRLSDQVLPFVVWGVGSLSLALLAVERAKWAVVVFVLVFGASGGMAVLLRATLIADLYGRTNYGGIAAVTSAASNIARAAAPVTASLIILLPGGYDALLWLLALGTGLAALAGATAVRRAAVQRVAADAVDAQTWA